MLSSFFFSENRNKPIRRGRSDFKCHSMKFLDSGKTRKRSRSRKISLSNINVGKLGSKIQSAVKSSKSRKNSKNVEKDVKKCEIVFIVFSRLKLL